eukprot:jgi/Chlat1/4510/Chrsp29S04580
MQPRGQFSAENLAEMRPAPLISQDTISAALCVYTGQVLGSTVGGEAVAEEAVVVDLVEVRVHDGSHAMHNAGVAAGSEAAVASRISSNSKRPELPGVLLARPLGGSRSFRGFSGLRPSGLAHSQGRPHCRQQRYGLQVNASSNGSSYDYDVITIGAGSGGVRASRIASQLGAKVACVEMPFNSVSSDTEGGVGGTCVLRGCVPKKLLVYGSVFRNEFEDSAGFGWELPGEPKFTWQTLNENKNKELTRLNNVYRNILSKANVELLEGRASLVDAHTVDIDGKQLTAKNIILATGGRSSALPIPGAEFAIDSDKALALDEVPKSIAIYGGGYIAFEFACIFRGFGAKVDVFYRAPLPLRGFDEEIRNLLADELAKKGINLHPKCTAEEIRKESNGEYTLKTDCGEFKSDLVMFATGRKPNTKYLNLEAVGVDTTEKGAIVVDEYSCTTVPNIFAIGDVTNRINLTPVALMEGTAVARTIQGEPTKPDHVNVPSAVFTQPPIGTAGLTEEEAKEQFDEVDVYTSSFRPMKHTISGRDEKSLMKIIVDVKTDKVLGIHMLGESSPEILQGFAVALKCGVTKKQMDATIGIHPTAAEEFVTMRTVTRQHRKEKQQQQQQEEKEKVAAAK